ncbi:hypothetical protein DLJ48_01595 [Oenococcus sicerae]|uniref:Uncharacterized protein n=1 Tax=Oenococcus sicerae TaxID=2203724 RepID=A0ABX5QKN2_9LACO|nr:hypothetical protein [Oenococcus sicerae]QAS69309.2 hypothetical protein DLJ48_01595 [Oenococcus sicerae]
MNAIERMEFILDTRTLAELQAKTNLTETEITQLTSRELRVFKLEPMAQITLLSMYEKAYPTDDDNEVIDQAQVTKRSDRLIDRIVTEISARWLAFLNRFR